MKTAMYLRISSEDEDLRTGEKNESESISNQRSLLREYVSGHAELAGSEILEFCDDGWSGTNFERPAVKELLEQVRRRQINCIVVKDLSRFGRNYKETGNYLERIFPFLGVRFIAVNDGFDTLTAQRGADGYLVPLKNLINEVYSKDISKKSGSALAAKQKNGDFIGAWAPYGYRKREDDPHKLEPDEALIDIMLKAIEVQKKSEQWQRDNGQYIPHPSTWLNQRRWEDEMEVKQKNDGIKYYDKYKR